MNFFLCLMATLLFCGVVQAGPAVARLLLPVQPRQLIVVVTSNWQAVDGQLQRFEWTEPTWQAIGKPIRVVVGRNGLGWGLGLHPMPEDGPQKKEGDGRAPAGIFALRYAFGFDPPEKLAGIKIPYVQCTGRLECVDDPKSSHYNQILDRPTNGAPDWNSSERMRSPDGEYRLGIVVEHNTSPPVPGGGSCVFMHIWSGPGIGTAGCTAMREGDIESLISWIDAQSFPVLVQLPQSECDRVKKAWRLPEMPAQ